jgi:hypothetical protein
MMIGQHPRLFGFPELKLFAYATVGGLDIRLPDTAASAHRAPGLLRAIAELFAHEQSAKSLDAARRWLAERGEWRGEQVFDLLMERIWPRVAVEKSPEHALSDAVLERITCAYPRARYIHLTRHPVTTQASMRRHTRLTDDDAMTFCFYSWYEINFRLLEFGATVSDHYLRVRAEDVLNEPQHHLRRIACWLGLPADAGSVEAMQHPERSPFASLGADGTPATGGNDPQFLRNPTPHRVHCPRAVERPIDWNGPDSLWSAVIELASTMGY